MPDKQLRRLKTLLQEAETNLAAARELLASVLNDDGAVVAPANITTEPLEGKVIEGIFDGQVMVGPDDRNYPVPSNYASKSKLVEGDVLKLTITPEGNFLYKQIDPVARRNAIGILKMRDGLYYADVDGKDYRVLLASVTFFKLKVGERVAVIVPADNPDASWAAVEMSL
ncbi:MAG: hypothetical protein LBM12_01050 [Candidatus Nomurabacteria bacterium]|jgi:hypothetical protein|nr:hypothetical protein [Candidatus Nomurabacteria bacterium]